MVCYGDLKGIQTGLAKATDHPSKTTQVPTAVVRGISAKGFLPLGVMEMCVMLTRGQ